MLLVTLVRRLLCAANRSRRLEGVHTLVCVSGLRGGGAVEFIVCSLVSLPKSMDETAGQRRSGGRAIT
jgi:hypothetical protein